MQQSSGVDRGNTTQLSSDIINLASVDQCQGSWNQSIVQYWIKTVCCRGKDHFHWTAPLYPAGPKSGGHCPPHPPVAPPMLSTDTHPIHRAAHALGNTLNT